MDEELLLTVLKQDLKTPPSEEPYLRTLLKNAEALMKRMGIQDDGSMDYHIMRRSCTANAHHLK